MTEEYWDDEEYEDDDDDFEDAVNEERASNSISGIRCRLTGRDGNAFSIMGFVADALRKGGRRDLIDAYTEEAMSGDYDHLLQTSMKYVDVD